MYLGVGRLDHFLTTNLLINLFEHKAQDRSIWKIIVSMNDGAELAIFDILFF